MKKLVLALGIILTATPSLAGDQLQYLTPGRIEIRPDPRFGEWVVEGRIEVNDSGVYLVLPTLGATELLAGCELNKDGECVAYAVFDTNEKQVRYLFLPPRTAGEFGPLVTEECFDKGMEIKWYDGGEDCGPALGVYDWSQ